MRSQAARVLILLLGVTAGATAGEVYRYVDQDGVVHYTDRPPTPGSRPLKLPPIQSTSSIVPARGSGAGPEEVVAAQKVGVAVASPTADETFRGDDGHLPVSLRLDAPLPGGHGLMFLLDGTAQNAEPAKSLSYVFDHVERGSHLISATVVDASGREVGRAAPVIVHMKPPTVDQAPRIPRPPASR